MVPQNIGYKLVFFRKLLMIAALSCTQSAIAQFVFYESFQGSSAPGWTFQQKDTSPGPRLTAGTAPGTNDPETGTQIDSEGNGWLRLANLSGNQDNAVTLNTDIPSSANNITIEFDFTMWDRGSGAADGISVFLYDADVTFDAGANGGSLSYAQKSGVNGLAGGYLGVGLDVWGNFSNATEGRTGEAGGSNPGFLPNEVVVRGPDDSVAQDGSGNYYYLAGTGGNNYTVGGDPAIASLTASQNLNFDGQNFRPDQDADDFRRFKLNLDDSDNLTVSLEFGKDTGYIDLFTADVSGFIRPENLRIGFGAATGGAQQVHEIRNLLITADGQANTWYWTDVADDDVWNNATNWNPSSSVPADYGDIVFSDAFATTDTDDIIAVDGSDKLVGSIFFTGQHAYTLTPDTNQEITLDTNGSGHSAISVTNNPNGNADHTVAVNLNLNNEFDIANLVNQTLTISGNIDSNSNDIDIETAGTTLISGIISEGADITLTGNGKTIFSGANTYTGTTTVTNGILEIQNNAGLGNTGSDTVVQDGATLALANDITTGAGESVTIAGTGEGGLGALSNTSGSNTWNGNITLTAASTIGAESGTLTLDTSALSMGAFDLTLEADSGATISIDQIIDDGGSTSDLIVNGAGTVILTATNAYDGATTVNSGVLQIEAANALGDAGANTTVNSGGTLALAGNINTNPNEGLTLSSNGVSGKAGLWSESGNNTWDDTIALTGGGGSIGANTGASLTVDGVISGAGQALTIAGDGTTILNSANTYTGATNITNGTLQIAAANRISNSSAIVLTDVAGALLDLNDFNETVGSLAGGGSNGGNVDLGTGTLTTGGDNTSTSYDGVISGTGNLTKQGTGTMQFSGANTFTGNLEINNGTVQINSANTFADNMDLILDGGTFAINGVADTIGDFTLQSDSSFDFLSQVGGNLTLDSILAPTGNLTVNNWIGTTAGNGDTQLIVSAGSITANMTTLANNTSFAGFGTSSQWVNLGGGFHELVPDFTGFFEWDGSEPDNNWDTGNNWVGGVAPNATTAQVLIGELDNNLDGKVINFPAGRRQLRDLVIDNDDTFTIRDASAGSDRLGFNQPGNGDTFLTVIGNASPTFDVELYFWDVMNIVNNSTGTLTFDGDLWLRDESLTTAFLNLSGSGNTVINGDIFDNNGSQKGLVTVDGTGTWTLNGNNTFSTGFTLNNGTVKVGSNTALGDGAVTINGGTLEATGAARSLDETFTINNSFTVGNDDGNDHDLTFTGNGTLSAGNQTITVEEDITFNLDGDLTGTGALIKEGDGTIDFDGNDTDFSGGLTVNAGTVQTSAGDNLVIGSDSGGNNYLGSGDITVNSGGNLTATMTGDNDIDINAGGTLTNNGGTITLQNTNANSDAEIFGNIVISDGTTTIDVGDNVDLEAGSDITLTGGILNINAGDNFQTLGTAGNTSDITASGGSTVNIDLSGGNTGVFTQDQDDTFSLDGATTTMNITGDAATNINLNGTLLLNNGSTLTVLAGETNLDTTTLLDGGTGTTKGTLEVRGDLNIDLPQMANDPNITLNITGTSEIASISGTTSIENIGVLTKTGTGTTTINANINNIQADRIDLIAGTLMNTDDDQIENDTPLHLSGGVWNTGGFDEVLGTLTLNNTSVIDLDNGNSIIEFADSTSTSGDWDTNDWLLIDNWSGDYINGGGTDQLIFSNAGLESTQLNRILFRNPVGAEPGNYFAQFIGDEIVPIVPIPEPETYVMGGLAACILLWFERRRRSARRS